jgi:hypothetical protein
MRKLIVAFAMFLGGCASYVTPGGAVQLDKFDRADLAEAASRKPAANFPARIAVARVQAPSYRSYTTASYPVAGRYSVVTTQELATDENFREMERWPAVVGVAPVSRLLLPEKLETLDDLRLSAAKLQADVLLIYTVDTTFNVQGRGYGPLAAISLGIVPDRDANVTSTASAILTDVRTGYIHGVAEATAKATGLTNFWSSSGTVDKKRLEAEREAFQLLVKEAGKTWAGIVRQSTPQITRAR